MTLLLHTSTPTIRIGIAETDTVVARDEFPSDRELAESLAERIRRLVHATTYTLPTVRQIVVHAGPGGFTSLRIGVTTANVLAYALDVPVVGVFGDIKDLDELLEKSNTAEPTASGIVVPIYSKPPNIGPIPSVV